jgi:sugar phosphate isomerase/epimerase
MRIGVSLSPTKSSFGPILFSGDLYKGIAAVKGLGYDGVELSLLDSAAVDKDTLLEALERQELEVYAIATGQTYYTDGYSLYNSNPDKRARAVERIRGHVELARLLGCRVIVGGIRGKVEESSEQDRLEILSQGREALKACVAYAEKASVTLLLEPINRYETNVINTVAEGVALIREIGSDCLRLLPDTFHMNIEERSLPESVIAAGKYLGYIHFADSNRLAPGWGHIDFYEILSALRSIGYGGPLGVEVLPNKRDFQSAQQALRHLRSMEQQLQQGGQGERLQA